MKKEYDEEEIWKDRKRFMGMPLSFTKYSVKNNRLYQSTGLFSSTENELLLYRIVDLKLNRTLVNKLFGVGTITIFTRDDSEKEIQLIRIKKSRQVRDLLSKMVEEERRKLKIQGKEIYGSSKGNYESDEYYDGDLDEQDDN